MTRPILLRLWRRETEADVNATEQQVGFTALIAAVQEGSNGVVVLLVEAGADSNASRPGGATPLRGASSFGSAAVLEMLLGAGVQVNLAQIRV